MEIPEEQYQRVEHLFPVARGRGKLSNRQVRNAVRYLAAPGYQGRGQPESFGNWPTVYRRRSRWKERGTLALVFAARQELGLPSESGAVLDLDSTSVKVHLEATGAPKKGGRKPWASPAAAGAPRYPGWWRTTAPL